jgi:MSHA biogenesis protein MshQ
MSLRVIPGRFSAILTFSALAAAGFFVTAAQAQSGYVDATLADGPLAYWQLDSNNGTSLVGGYTTTYVNGATTSAPGTGAPLAGNANNAALSLNGNNSTPQYVTTGLSGGVNGTGSIVAWVNLSELPSTAGAYFYIAGESQSGNDFDLQFQNNNTLYFYTGAGENTSYTPDPATLVNQWNQIVVTYDSTAGFRNIYWDGTLVSSVTGGINTASKTSAFTVGYSSVFGGRDFNGLIDEVAVFGSALDSSQVTQLYAESIPEPPTFALFAFGCAYVCLLPFKRRRSADAC